MSKQSRGFTIVEILIAVSVISILITVGAFGWSSMQTWSQNEARGQEVKQWASTLDLFKSRYGYYPGIPESSADGTNAYYYCLGDFATTSNRCGEYTSTTAARVRVATGTDSNAVVATTIRTELAKVGKTPTNSSQPINSRAIGPYVVYDKATSGTTVTMTAKIIGLFQGSSCPSGTTLESTPPMGAGISGVIACKIQKQLTYTL